jgi:hypothetical protein
LSKESIAMSLEVHLSPAKAAEVTGFPLSAIYAACTAKQLEHVRFSTRGSIHIATSAVAAWAGKHRIAAAERPDAQPASPIPVPRRTDAPSVRDLLRALRPEYEPQFQVSDAAGRRARAGHKVGSSRMINERARRSG